MRYTSSDNLVSSSNPELVAAWDSIGASMQAEQRAASAMLREMGVVAEHPDDGWVDRERGSVQFAYPAFDDGVRVGDLIALGWPWDGYRLVRCTAVTRRRLLIDTTHYSFEDTGTRVPSQRRAGE